MIGACTKSTENHFRTTVYRIQTIFFKSRFISIHNSDTERPLVETGSDIGHGHFYSHPVPDTEIIELIKSKNTHAGKVAEFTDSGKTKMPAEALGASCAGGMIR